MEASLNFEEPKEGTGLYGLSKRYVLDRPEITLGRSPDRDISVPAVFFDVSRDHCSFYRENGSLLFQDYSSSGTLINGSRVLSRVEIPLNSGDRLSFGNYLHARVVIRKGFIGKLKSLFR